MSSIVEQAGRTTPGVERSLRRGRVRILAATDLVALALAYGLTYLLADRIAPPAMTGPHLLFAGFWLAAATVLLAAFAAYGLYERDLLADPPPVPARRLRRHRRPLFSGVGLGERQRDDGCHGRTASRECLWQHVQHGHRRLL